MQPDRYTRIFVTLIAIGLWALVVSQLGSPIGDVHAGVPSSPPRAAERLPGSGYSPPGSVSVVRAAPSTLPLRWRIRSAVLMEYLTVDCTTIISVRNLAPTSTNVDVDWIDDTTTLIATSTSSLAPGYVQHFSITNTADTGTNTHPFLVLWASATTNFQGFAEVYATDPRISAAAFLRCDTEDADENPNTIASIPADPVGPTMEYFQAGMPMMGEKTRLAEPESQR